MTVTFASVKNAVFIIIFFVVARPVLPVLDYIINYDYITKVLCENKAKPKMHCNGKCHLMKELAKAAEQDKPASEKKTNHTEVEVLFLHPITTFTLSQPVYNIRTVKINNYSNLYSYLIGYSEFHPPALVA